jgi:hypothetical protein
MLDQIPADTSTSNRLAAAAVPYIEAPGRVSDSFSNHAAKYHNAVSFVGTKADTQLMRSAFRIAPWLVSQAVSITCGQSQ